MYFENAIYTVIKSNRKTVSLQVKPNEVTVRAPIKMKDSEIEKFVESKRKWIEKHLVNFEDKRKNLNNLDPYTNDEIQEFIGKAKDIIPPKVEFYAKKIDVTYNRISIRCQHTRWGSCSSKGNLNFNCLLVLLSDQIIDSIIVHELCHRKHMNHSAKFYAEVVKVLPNYNECKEWLNKNGSFYISRIPK